ncbi:MAG: M23 family metallopeptidase [Limisphaera sp.]|nr:M23 family metallopeptidase [Limisphaera sp.]
MRGGLVWLGILGWVAGAVATGPFRLPTPNQALFEPGGEARFFAPTPGRTWVAGTFGCTRSEGFQLHEGIDIRSVQRDRRGEPTDPVCAAADGTVAYINTNPSLSNYGRYIVLRHSVDGLEVYTLYAHLRAVAPDLRPGREVRAGQPIGTLGRSTNTRTPISKDRAHLHFEIALMISDRFDAWFRRTEPRERNDHGNFNGRNFLGLDPVAVFRAQQREGPRFSFRRLVQEQVPLCTVQVRQGEFGWVRRYAALVEPAAVRTAPVAGYDVTFNFSGLPFRLVPRSAAELRPGGKYVLLQVNEAEVNRCRCQALVTRQGNRWALSPRGLGLLDLLTY